MHLLKLTRPKTILGKNSLCCKLKKPFNSLLHVYKMKENYPKLLTVCNSTTKHNFEQL